MAIIFIPGIKGCALTDAATSTHTYWPLPTTAQALQNAMRALAYDAHEQPRRVHATQVLPEIAAPLLTRLKQVFPQESIISFAYDWRESIMDSARHLLQWLHTVQKTLPTAAPLHFITHSMGGLILRAALHLPGSEPLHKAFAGSIMTAPPFRGSLGAVYALALGDPQPVPRQLRALYLASSRSFPATYGLLPTFADAVVDADGHAVDLFTRKTWQGIENANSLHVDFLQLAPALPWHHEACRLQSLADKLLILAGSGLPTPYQLQTSQQQPQLDFTHVRTRMSGDGRVLLTSAALAGVPLAIVPAVKSHGTFCHEPKVIDIITRWLGRDLHIHAGTEGDAAIDAIMDPALYTWDGSNDTITSHVV